MRSNQPRSAPSLARPNNGRAMAAAIEIQPSTANRVGNLAGGAATISASPSTTREPMPK